MEHGLPLSVVGRWIGGVSGGGGVGGAVEGHPGLPLQVVGDATHAALHGVHAQVLHIPHPRPLTGPRCSLQMAALGCLEFSLAAPNFSALLWGKPEIGRKFLFGVSNPDSYCNAWQERGGGG